MYRLVCMACHDTDGKGKIVRLAMPSIPDLTDPKWQASRTDAELLHSILEGKESTVNGVKIPLMLPMKDKLALAHTEVKDMVAFMRAFKDGKQVVSATPGGARSRRAGWQVAADHPCPPPTPAPASPPAPAPASALPARRPVRRLSRHAVPPTTPDTGRCRSARASPSSACRHRSPAPRCLPHFRWPR